MIERITQQFVETAPTPERNERALYSDPDLRGFYLIVTPTRRSYYAQSLKDGRQVRVKVGEHPKMLADDARTAVSKVLADMRAAGAPQAIATAMPSAPRPTSPAPSPLGTAAAQPTVPDAKESFPTPREALELHLKSRRLSQRTKDEYRYTIETYLKDWLDRPLDAIGRDRRPVRERHANLTERSGLATADSVMRVLRAVYNRAAREYLDLPRNPTESVDFHGTRRRSTTLVHPGVLVKWAKAVAAIENPVRADLQRFVLLSAMRRTAAIEMRWEHVDLDGDMVFVPNPKGGKDRAFSLVLSDAMRDLLRRRREATKPECPWVWPALSESGHTVARRRRSADP